MYILLWLISIMLFAGFIYMILIIKPAIDEIINGIQELINKDI